MATEAVQVLDAEINLDDFGGEYQEKALVLQGEVSLTKIEDDNQFQRVSKAGLDAASNVKAITALLEPMKTARYAAWKRVTDVLSSKTKPFEEVKAKASRLVGAYQFEIRQRREQEEAAERARIAKEQEATRAQQAEQLAREDRIEDGLALLEQPQIDMAPVMATSQVPSVKGVTSSGDGVYGAEVTSLMELCKAVVAGTVPIVAIEPNMKFLTQQAKSLKQLLNYPGVKVVRTFKSGFRPK